MQRLESVFETLYNFFVYHLEVIRYSDSYSALGPTMVQILEMELNWSVVSKQSHKYIIIATFIVFPQPQQISTWFMIWVGGKNTTLLMGIYKFYSCFKGEERLEEIADCCCYELGKDYGYNEILHFDDLRIESIICIKCIIFNQHLKLSLIDIKSIIKKTSGMFGWTHFQKWSNFVTFEYQ